VHGLSQALQKRGLPRAIMMDNGSAMKAKELVEGLEGEYGLGIVLEHTLEYSPYQNAKQEVFFALVEGRLMAMLEGERELTLSLLNEATQAWAELEYHREDHSETKQAPLERFLAGPSVLRDCPGSDELRRCFRATLTRQQRRSDGTVVVHGVRFEVPSRYRTLERVTLRYARWDLSTIDMIDARHGHVLCSLYPLDKTRNADGKRKRVTPLTDEPDTAVEPSGIAPLLAKLMADYSATGLPPGYLPKEDQR
jgi:putative transposase